MLYSIGNNGDNGRSSRSTDRFRAGSGPGDTGRRSSGANRHIELRHHAQAREALRRWLICGWEEGGCVGKLCLSADGSPRVFELRAPTSHVLGFGETALIALCLALIPAVALHLALLTVQQFGPHVAVRHAGCARRHRVDVAPASHPRRCAPSTRSTTAFLSWSGASPGRARRWRSWSTKAHAEWSLPRSCPSGCDALGLQVHVHCI